MHNVAGGRCLAVEVGVFGRRKRRFAYRVT
jgi:hypothetical protein